ncbi:MAG: hypothetical protein UDD25_00025 [Mitsuokella jalaludinii]|uniref:hypothetical protein n=1 Tax=Mitsuokella jalaludinii TaxID=187979 RepID=UPI0020D012DD|nr:hypothetical protein [Mitsuokella jalaludinii]MCQ1533529.1 hypothetical protein [Mitsuokella jalaludinii]MEE0480628.1 hypothetical protein [Mitsuokella jalaludinii]
MSIFPKKKKWRFLLGAIIIAVIAIFATSNGSSPLNKNIQIVQNGYLEAIPNQKIGPAFKEFFGEPKWTSFTSTDNKEVVEFTGKCRWNGEPADFKMQFIMLKDGNFRVGAMKINDESMNILESAAIMKKIISEKASSGS